MYKVGIDLGSSYTKGVLVDSSNQIIDYHLVKTGFDFNRSSKRIIDKFSENFKIDLPIYTCGYGREKLEVESVSNSEIMALAEAVYHLYNKKCSVIDIGGQDTKYIKINEIGKVDKFRMNRKCAAGTGSFLEEIAFRLDVSATEFNSFAEQATETIKINSFCTVFAVSEIVGMIKNGLTMPNIVLGIYNSILDRSFELANIDDSLILTGGIPDYHPIILKLIQKKIPNAVSPEKSQFMAAYGSVLLNTKRVN
ncbi:MAG: hypothetical protein A2X64_08520 [Ignavibacteria bacterium GWF2_33_9]|nr:MAG: hypothetical protein A2X64_08520 [Ignavibacteria bacterium GWF2_33_9]